MVARRPTVVAEQPRAVFAYTGSDEGQSPPQAMKLLIPSFLAVNRSLLPVKIHFFLFYAATGCGLPFRTVFAKKLGISSSAIGTIFAATSLFRLFTNPVFGVILDKFKKFRLTVGVSLILVGVSHLAMVYIPPVSLAEESDKNDICDAITEVAKSKNFFSYLHNDTVLCKINCTFELPNDGTIKGDDAIPCTLLRLDRFYFLNPSSTSRDEIGIITMNGHDRVSDDDLETKIDGNFNMFHMHKETDLQMYSCCHMNSCLSATCAVYELSSKEQFNSSSTETSLNSFTSTQFGLFLFLMLISSSSITAVIFLVDAICYEILDDKPEKYGAQRLFGTMGWGIGGLIGGYLNQLFTATSADTDYSPCFYMLALLSCIDLIPVAFVEVKNAKHSPSVWKETTKVLSSPYVATYVTMVFFAGVLSGPIWNYGFWFLEEIGASQLLLGLAHVVDCFIAELPCFLASGWIIQKIGFINCNSLTFLFFGLRYLSFFYMYDPWWSLPAGLLHGPTFGLFYASATAFAKQNSPPGAEGTAQAIIAAAFESLGVAVGSVLCGVGFDIVGYRTTFLYTSICSFVLLLTNVVLQRFLPNQKENDAAGDKGQGSHIVSSLTSHTKDPDVIPPLGYVSNTVRDS